MNKIKISIIVPTYNVEAYIEQCIGSLIAQSLKEIEIIVVDDGSEDNTRELIKAFAEKDNRIRTFFCQHAGLSKARNTGIKEAQGDYITFVDSDDWIAAFACKELHNRANATNADIVLGNRAIRYYEDGRTDKWGESAKVFTDQQIQTGQESFRKLIETGYYMPMVWGKLYRRDFILKNNLYFELQFHEDEHFSAFAFYYAKRVTVFQKDFYYYRQREGSIIFSANLLNRANSLFQAGQKITLFFEKEKNIPDNVLSAFYNLAGRLYSNARSLYEKYICTIKNCLFIFTRESIAGQYGIGTYINELIRCFNLSEWMVQVVELNSTVSQENYELKNGVAYYKLPSNEQFVPDWDALNEKRYYRNVYYFLADIAGGRNVYCHFNFSSHHELAILFKQKLQARVVFTLHYTDWSFDLLGNKEWLTRILAKPTGHKEQRVIKKFNEEKKMMSEACDRVIAIANHSLETIKELYGIPADKISLIHNGLKDNYKKRSEYEIACLKNKYGFTNNEKLILFAGRLDLVKGIVELIHAFKQLEFKNTKLIIAGSGNYSRCLEAAGPKWSDIIFTGFIQREQLHELYAIADLGIVPSIHEEFGYVAVEMIMNELPVLVNNTTGLKEIVEEGKYGIICDFQEDASSSLKAGIEKFFKSPSLYKRVLPFARRRMLEKYTIDIFSRKMIAIYHCMENPCNYSNKLKNET